MFGIKKIITAIIFACMLVALLPSNLPVKAANKNETVMSSSKATIMQGDYYKLILKWTSGDKSISWSSSNKKVATVTSDGMVYGKKAGKATITAKYNGKKYTCAITVGKRTKAAEKIYEPGTMSIAGDWIYYIDFTSYAGTSLDYAKGKGGYICKMKTDGTGKTVLVKEMCNQMTVVDDVIYYNYVFSRDGFNTDFCYKLYSVKTDGTGKKALQKDDLKNDADYVIYNGKLYYISLQYKYKGTVKVLISDEDYYGIHCYDLKSAKDFQVSEYSTKAVTVAGGRLYYSGGKTAPALMSTNLDGTGTMTHGTVFGDVTNNLVQIGNKIYYQNKLNAKSNTAGYIVSRRLDGTGSVEKIMDPGTSVSMGAGGNYVYYSTNNAVYRVNVNSHELEQICDKAMNIAQMPLDNMLAKGFVQDSFEYIYYNGSEWVRASNTVSELAKTLSTQKSFPAKIAKAVEVKASSCSGTVKDNAEQIPDVLSIVYVVSNLSGPVDGKVKTVDVVNKASDAVITYKSGDSSVVKVDKNGNYTHVGPGNATIYVTYNYNKVFEVKITVYDNGFTEKSYEAYVGDTIVTLTTGTVSEKMKSSDTSVADFTEGKYSNSLVCKKAGECTISAKIDGKTYTAKVTVKAKENNKGKASDGLGASPVKFEMGFWKVPFNSAVITADSNLITCIGPSTDSYKNGTPITGNCRSAWFIYCYSDMDGSFLMEPDERGLSEYLSIVVAGNKYAEGTKLVLSDSRSNQQKYILENADGGYYIRLANKDFYLMLATDGSIVLTGTKNKASIFNLYTK